MKWSRGDPETGFALLIILTFVVVVVVVLFLLGVRP